MDKSPAKRTHDGSEKKTVEHVSPFISMFEGFKKEIDEHHDRRERIIKASRDITATSKKIVKALKKDFPKAVATETQERSIAISDLFKSISPDLKGINAWRYHLQISGGIQEYMEAISFRHYLQTQRLITQAEALNTIPEGVQLTGDDFLLGILDLVGELMRFTITTIALTGSLPRTKDENNEDRTVLNDLRSLQTQIVTLDIRSVEHGLAKELEKKMQVMAQSVEKVEVAFYGIIIRGRERPVGWVPDLENDRPPQESY